MLAFAANSVLTRLALEGAGEISPGGFAIMRVASAALALVALLFAQRGAGFAPRWSLATAVSLAVYIVGFTFGYVDLSAATGALILFSSVQLTMFAVTLYEGERFSRTATAGIALAFGGLVYLLAPGATAPDPLGAALMIASGIGWGVFSLLGRGASDPLSAVAGSFILCLPIVTVASLDFGAAGYGLGTAGWSTPGILLALASGGAASAGGYILWYSVLPHLTGGQAAIVQVSVPAIVALGGAIFIAEPLTAQLVIASLTILGGLALALLTRKPA